MKKNSLILILLSTMVQALFAMNYDPVAQDEAVIISDQARFTVLTPHVIRMEWAEDGIFENSSSRI